MNTGSQSSNPDRETVEHTRVGVWDHYQEKTQRRLLGLKSLGLLKPEHYREIPRNLKYVWRMLKDVTQIRGTRVLLFSYIIIMIVQSIIPAVSMWYSGQLLTVVKTAVDTRTVDMDYLLRVFIGRVGCTVAKELLQGMGIRISQPIELRIKQHYTKHLVSACARLDLPTYGDPAVKSKLENVYPARDEIVWRTVRILLATITMTIQLGSEMSVLLAILWDQVDGTLFIGTSLLYALLRWMLRGMDDLHMSLFTPWTAICYNRDYLRMQGLKELATRDEYHQEFVAGNMQEYCLSEYIKLAERLGDDAESYTDIDREKVINQYSLLNQCLHETPQVIFALRAARHPASLPISMTSLRLIEQSAESIGFLLHGFLDRVDLLAEQFTRIRQLYEVADIPNQVKDGSNPFPEDMQKIQAGIRIEFRNVSFKYPGKDDYVLRNISFEIQPGQLCVIVGINGSGKSTILKLIARLYDVCDGQILIDGRDIRTLKLRDLRNTIAVLFQEFQEFGLSMRDNIALGNPSNADNDEDIRLAARLGGADEFIERLRDGYDTYLHSPVGDIYGGGWLKASPHLEEQISHLRIPKTALSGGQSQRLAVSRIFMRSIVTAGSAIGLLLFDEPSASLDPTAEHDLFSRLRELRGNKTMLFSSHRFGNLTKHADMILYMNDSTIVESGTHEELIAHDGEYAKTWLLQAQAFL